MNTSVLPSGKRNLRAGRPWLRGLALAPLAAALGVCATALAAAPAPVQPPRQWTGTAHYVETRQSGDEKQQASISVRITLGHIATKGHSKWEYIAKTGSGSLDASGSDQLCTWKSAGSRPVNQYDLYLIIERPGPPYRASFSGQDSMDVPVTQTCAYGNGTQTSSTTKSLTHPFFVLGRITAGVPVDARLTTIRGHRSGSEHATGFSYRWTYSWAFAARR